MISERRSLEFFSADDLDALRGPYFPPFSISLPLFANTNNSEKWDPRSNRSVDPAPIFAVFTSLKVRPGFVVRVYQSAHSEGLKGMFWTMPREYEKVSRDATEVNGEYRNFSPEFKRLSRFNYTSILPPPHALDDFMEAIEGDDSNWSYISASIFAREMKEMGAFDHGLDWSMHSIFDEAPKTDFSELPDGSAEYFLSKGIQRWTWLEPEPDEWRPCVNAQDDVITVTFYTYCSLGKESIYRHTDTFQHGNYALKSEKTTIAEGIWEMRI